MQLNIILEKYNPNLLCIFPESRDNVENITIDTVIASLILPGLNVSRVFIKSPMNTPLENPKQYNNVLFQNFS